jgi:Amidohydrolase family
MRGPTFSSTTVSSKPWGQAQVRVSARAGLSGPMAMPGLVNCHFHSPGNLLKGAIPNLPLDLFMLYEVPPFLVDPASRELAYLRTCLGAVEMLKQGVTAVHDDAFFLPVVSDDEVTGVMEAYRDSGIRATVALDQPNRVEYEKHAFLRDLLPERVIGQMDRAAASQKRNWSTSTAPSSAGGMEPMAGAFGQPYRARLPSGSRRAICARFQT